MGRMFGSAIPHWWIEGGSREDKDIRKDSPNHKYGKIVHETHVHRDLRSTVERMDVTIPQEPIMKGLQKECIQFLPDSNCIYLYM